MGCTTSKPVIETTDDVLKNCKIRRLHVKHAIKYRKDFAIAHAAYIHSLKDVGFAFKYFTGGDFSDMDVSSLPSSTPVLALPPPSSPSLADLSPPRQSCFIAPTLSPPQSLSSETRDVPSTLPPEICISPPLSPMRLPTTDNHLLPLPPTRNQSSLPLDSPSTSPPNNHLLPLPPTSNQSSSPLDSPSTSPPNTRPLANPAATPLRAHSFDSSMVELRTQSFNNMVSPDRGSEFSPPYYSPSRDDLDEALVAYSPSPPSSLITDTTWFNVDSFLPPLIPHHLQEQRRMKHVSDLEQENLTVVSKVEEVEEEIPELEEPDHEEDGIIHNDGDTASTNDRVMTPTDEKGPTSTSEKDALLNDMMPEEVEKRVVLDETVESSESKISGDDPSIDNASNLPKEPVESGVLKKKLGPAVVLKERTLTEAMEYVVDFCIRAYRCGRDVSRMLETQMHFQAKENGAKDSLKLLNSISSHWSRKTSFVMGDNVDDDDDDEGWECGMAGSHASTLERLYAWERKLHHEVKVDIFFSML
ncbi:hypothetical protein L7F22_067428 [Adiantum nelumboides]|nr:hypothetical protein [Adiantum nelumboides]